MKQRWYKTSVPRTVPLGIIVVVIVFFANHLAGGTGSRLVVLFVELGGLVLMGWALWSMYMTAKHMGDNDSPNDDDPQSKE
jgi:uncharacterized membrane protein YqgA involved in biofilm formation